MTSYLLRRLLASVLILLGASFIVYILIAYSGDPLQEYRASNLPNRAQLMEARSNLLNLDVPPVLRYFLWLGGAVKCVVPFAQCDLGSSIQGQPVTAALSSAIPSTLQLVTGAALLAITIGIAVGIVTALRQYSALDYSVTFIAFLFFSLPVFWVAVLLKEFGAIGFNDFLADPRFTTRTIVLVSLISGVVWTVILSGSWARRAITFAAAAVVTGGIMYYLSASDWFAYPGIGPEVLVVLGAGVAVAVTAIIAGLQNRRALYASLSMVVVGVVMMTVAAPLLNSVSLGLLLLLGVLAVGVGYLTGHLFGGYDPAQSRKAAGLTSFIVAVLVALDRVMQAWPTYYNNGRVHGRPIATIGSATPNLSGDFWVHAADKYGHLVLPTFALLLISLASYTRYSRSSMLEVMEQDYVRTARAKGLSERVVVVRHAFRNALIPLATVVAFDIGQLIGGAVITENVFSFKGMGTLFITGIKNVDPNPVMGVFVIVGITAVTFNLLADLAYSALDPRVRVRA
ncbi:ABC transporter permease [Isoptericola sp. b441]|uniref:ABC transporter permease n=1 Tax=Actinotalea lenta TaxID=3064654 RepID=A0ABT9DC49_9CELL|nr:MULTISPECIES: ABC transporter permease [unclassified Isoptericola]MDO8106871.1 ABC transporter permease [Isoptericola sp. b441]MDO8121419.1 ABC transporter permease [Isoptericola sp. b490]